MHSSLIVSYFFTFLLFWAPLCLVVRANKYFFGALYKDSDALFRKDNQRCVPSKLSANSEYDENNKACAFISTTFSADHDNDNDFLFNYV